MREWIAAVVLGLGCAAESDPASDADSDPDTIECATNEIKSDGCNSCECLGGTWACTEKACPVRWRPEDRAGPLCYPLCPEIDDPRLILERLECAVLTESEAGSDLLSICDGQTTGCVHLAVDRHGITSDPDDDVAAECLAEGSGLELRLLDLDLAGAALVAACTIRFAADPAQCMP
jgi:hypothetical protein